MYTSLSISFQGNLPLVSLSRSATFFLLLRHPHTPHPRIKGLSRPPPTEGLAGDTKFVGGWEQLPQRATLPMKGAVAAARYKQAGRLASATSHQPSHIPSCRRDYRHHGPLNSTLCHKNTRQVIPGASLFITRALRRKTTLVRGGHKGEGKPWRTRQKTGVCAGKVRVGN